MPVVPVEPAHVLSTFRVNLEVGVYRVDAKGVMEQVDLHDAPVEVRRLVAEIAWGATEAMSKSSTCVSVLGQIEVEEEDESD